MMGLIINPAGTHAKLLERLEKIADDGSSCKSLHLGAGLVIFNLLVMPFASDWIAF